MEQEGNWVWVWISEETIKAEIINMGSDSTLAFKSHENKVNHLERYVKRGGVWKDWKGKKKREEFGFAEERGTVNYCLMLLKSQETMENIN